MRDLILLAALVAAIPMILRAPLVGLLVWIWVTLMNPHREVFGFMFGAQLNLFVALVTFAAWGMSKERKIVPLDLFSLCLLAFAGWTCVTTYFALDPKTAYPLWDRTIKSIILVLAVITLANTKARLQAVIWMVAISLGYYAVKGAGFTLLSGGGERVYGPEDSQIYDNNTMGLALVVLLPLINYLRATSRLRITRYGSVATIGMTLVAIIGTYSRGALVGLGAMGMAFAMRSKFGFVLVLVGGLLATTLPNFMPQQWLNRMSTIQDYDQDASFNSRVAAWKTSYAIAKARPAIGGGFSAVKVDDVVQRYHIPGGLTKIGRAAHSIYFEVLGDHGFLGFGLYLLVLGSALTNTFLVLNLTRERSDLQWAKELARMLQVSMVGFLVSGAALSMAYYDGMLLLLGLTAALLHIVREPATELAAATAGPRWKQMAVGALDAEAAARRRPGA